MLRVVPPEGRELENLNASSYSSWLRAVTGRHGFPGASDLPEVLGVNRPQGSEKVPTQTSVLAAGCRDSVS